MRLFWAGARGVRARRDAAGRAPGDCSAWGEAPGYCFEREQEEFRFDELPQGECREIALREGGKQGAGDCSERENGGSGSKSCRRASAGRLFCVGKGGGGGGGILC